MPDTARVFTYALLPAFATGLGALPFAFVRGISPAVVAWTNAIASGVMLGASFGLVAEGARYGAWERVAGATVGVGFILFAQRVLTRAGVRFEVARGPGAQGELLMIIVM